jgi:hypothetical protein
MVDIIEDFITFIQDLFSPIFENITTPIRAIDTRRTTTAIGGPQDASYYLPPRRITPGQTGSEFLPEKGKENQSPYGYEEDSTPIESLPGGGEFRDMYDPPTVKDPRQVQADTLEQQWRTAALQEARTKRYPPLSEAQIARELQRHPIGWDAKGGLVPIRSYPGFKVRPDGLLQWDGHTIPEFLRGVYNEGINCTSGASSKSTSPEDVVYCATMREEYRQLMEQLRNRPWYPGYDATALISQQKAGDVQFERDKLAHMDPREFSRGGGGRIEPGYEFAAQLSKSFRNINDINYLVSRPQPMITAQEELTRIQTPSQAMALRRQESALNREMLQERRNRVSGNLDPGEAELIAKQQAEKAARKAAAQQWFDTTKQQGLAQQLAELQRWVQTSNYVQALYTDNGRNWFRGRRGF